MNPDPIERIERLLRDLIHDVMAQKYGPNWVDDQEAGLGPKWADELREKAQADHAQQRFATRDLPISYSEFRDLGELLKKHQQMFAPVFNDWDIFWAYYRTAEQLRNTVKHHRDISPSQHSLLQGIAGELEDMVTLWRTGVSLHPIRMRVQFQNLVQTTNSTEDAVLSEQRELAQAWREKFLKATGADSRDPRATQIEETPDTVVVRVGQSQLVISGHSGTSPNHRIADVDYRNVHVELVHNVAATLNLTQLVRSLGRPYRHLEYELSGEIDLVALSEWSSRRAGLDPGGSMSVDELLRSIDYRLLGGRMLLRASNSEEQGGKLTGRISVTVDSPIALWRAHDHLTARDLLGFMVGSITPKAMMHLLALAQEA